MVRFGVGLLGVHPAGAMVGMVRAADELGFHACYLSDSSWTRDSWAVVAAAARETSSIRLGFAATHVYLRDPVLIAQALATLDELSDGRIEAAVSFGDPSVLDAHHVQWRGRRPLARLREAFEVMRAYLDDGAVDHQGEFFRYSGIQAGARPVQAHLPLFVGALGGPRSFGLAGEVADGVECSSTARVNSEYVVEHVRRGAERAGRGGEDLRIGSGFIAAVAEDGRVAKEAAWAVAAAWLPSYPERMVVRHGLDPDQVAPIIAAVNDGNVGEALRRVTPEVGEALTVAGTPEECAERIRTDLVDAGIHHICFDVVDPVAVEAITGARPHGLPDVREQLRLIRDRIFPAFPRSGPR